MQSIVDDQATWINSDIETVRAVQKRNLMTATRLINADRRKGTDDVSLNRSDLERVERFLRRKKSAHVDTQMIRWIQIAVCNCDSNFAFRRVFDRRVRLNLSITQSSRFFAYHVHVSSAVELWRINRNRFHVNIAKRCHCSAWKDNECNVS